MVKVIEWWRQPCCSKYDFGKEYDFGCISREEKKKFLETYFNATQNRYVIAMLNKDAEELKLNKIDDGLIGAEKTFVFEPNPLVGNSPPLIKDSSEVRK